jgi:hypothetical protein
MEKWRLKLAFGRGGWVVIFENHPDFVKAIFPRGLQMQNNNIKLC